MKAINDEMIMLLGTLNLCMAKHKGTCLEHKATRSGEDDLERFKRYLSTLSVKEREVILDELQRFIWLHDVA